MRAGKEKKNSSKKKELRIEQYKWGGIGESLFIKLRRTEGIKKREEIGFIDVDREKAMKEIKALVESSSKHSGL